MTIQALLNSKPNLKYRLSEVLITIIDSEYNELLYDGYIEHICSWLFDYEIKQYTINANRFIIHV